MPSRDLSRWTQTETGSWRYTPNQGVVQVEMADSDEYEDMTKVELQAELESRDLPTSGNKDELIARLTEADSA